MTEQSSYHWEPFAGTAKSMSVTIHKTAEVSTRAVIGEGTSVWNDVQIREGARIGKNCRIGKCAYIGKDVVIGDGCKIQNRATIYRGVTLGDYVFIGPHVTFTNDPYPRAAAQDFQLVSTEVEDHASIGAGVVVVCGVRIGKYAMIGAGSVVTKSVPPHALAYGNPARVVGHVCECGHPLSEDNVCANCGRTIEVG
ncbi:MAG: acyltransferase [Thermoplasmata archaeon]